MTDRSTEGWDVRRADCAGGDEIVDHFDDLAAALRRRDELVGTHDAKVYAFVVVDADDPERGVFEWDDVVDTSPQIDHLADQPSREGEPYVAGRSGQWSEERILACDCCGPVSRFEVATDAENEDVMIHEAPLSLRVQRRIGQAEGICRAEVTWTQVVPASTLQAAEAERDELDEVLTDIHLTLAAYAPETPKRSAEAIRDLIDGRHAAEAREQKALDSRDLAVRQLAEARDQRSVAEAREDALREGIRRLSDEVKAWDSHTNHGESFEMQRAADQRLREAARAARALLTQEGTDES